MEMIVNSGSAVQLPSLACAHLTKVETVMDSCFCLVGPHQRGMAAVKLASTRKGVQQFFHCFSVLNASLCFPKAEKHRSRYSEKQNVNPQLPEC